MKRIVLCYLFFFSFIAHSYVNAKECFDSKLSVKLKKLEILNTALYHKYRAYEEQNIDKTDDVLALKKIILEEIKNLKKSAYCNSFNDYIKSYIGYLASTNYLYMELSNFENVKQNNELKKIFFTLNKNALFFIVYKKKKNTTFDELNEILKSPYMRKIISNREQKTAIRKNINYELNKLSVELHKIALLKQNDVIKENKRIYALNESLEKLRKLVKKNKELGKIKIHVDESSTISKEHLDQVKLFFEKENILIYEKKAGLIRRILFLSKVNEYLDKNTALKEEFYDILFIVSEWDDEF